MPDTTRLEARLSAALLQAASPALALGGVLVLLAGGGLLLATQQAAAPGACLFALALAGVPGLIWYGLRLRFDVAAFAEIGQFEDISVALPAFDHALEQLGLRSGQDPRTLAQRAQASRKLLVRLILVISWQLLLFLAGCAAMLMH
jgi:hypothetical protein